MLYLVGRDSELIVFATGTEGKLVGIILLLLGLGIGLAPLLPSFRNSSLLALLLAAAVSLAFVLFGLRMATYSHSLALDRLSQAITVSSGALLSRTKETVPFSDIKDVAVEDRIYATARVAYPIHSLQLRLRDGRIFRIEDESINRDREQVFARAEEIASFTGSVVNPEAVRR